MGDRKGSNVVVRLLIVVIGLMVVVPVVVVGVGVGVMFCGGLVGWMFSARPAPPVGLVGVSDGDPIAQVALDLPANPG